MNETKLTRESNFHDDWAKQTDPAQVDAEAVFFAPTALENGYLLARLGDLKGRRLLDIGCGLGESAVMFARLGAIVTASDISPEMLSVTRSLAAHYGVAVETVVGPAEKLQLPARSFDVIYSANTIHHLVDREAFFLGVRRLLKPSGVFCSWDPVKYNPVIQVYRKLATAVRSVDEAPLGRGHLREFRRHFERIETRHFWLLSLALFLKYFLVDRVSPNADRYWKRIYRETAHSLWWWTPLERADRWLLRLPLIRWMSWNVVVIARDPRRESSAKPVEESGRVSA